jgi:hypothetical protein
MDKKELTNVLNEVLVPVGFKRKGNYWVINGNEITKMINLQKSSHGNFFYINYGYILNSIPLDNEMMHVYNRVTSLDVEERNRITFLLDLDSKVSDQDRTKELKRILLDKLVSKIQSVNTEEELLEELRKRPHLNDIPLTVKKHFQIA